MIHYEDMRSKGGFSDGEAVPRLAWVFRSIYITALNHAAEKLGSNVRVVAYDRPGMHNPCLLIHVTVPMFMDMGCDKLGNGDPTASHPEVFEVMQRHGVPERVWPDEGFIEAEEVVTNMEVEQYVTTRGTLRKNAQAIMKVAMEKELAQFEG